MKLKQQKQNKTFTEIFDVILTGNKEESRMAAREVRKLLYGSHGDRFNEIEEMINTAPKKHASIEEPWREVNFVMAVSVLYYLHDKRNQRDFFFPWLLSLLLHKNGNIRYSAVKMIRMDLGPLTVHIRHPDYKQSKAKSKQSDLILLNLFVALNRMLVSIMKPAYKKYKYIDSLPSSSYKSIQLLFDTMHEYCGEDYISQFKDMLTRATVDK